MGHESDVLIVGGGIAGSLIASRLHHENNEAKITLLEKEPAITKPLPAFP